ncbi:unannotated protein [freshwater metagenome]|uniref:Unannotated protein n=1 Tax=freshwater metagenome TaxID=449393 RepID=A0A6J6ZVY7_9ZZZZ
MIFPSEVYYASFTLSRYLYYLSLKLTVSCVPIPAGSDWPLCGKQFCHMKFISSLITIIERTLFFSVSLYILYKKPALVYRLHNSYVGAKV